MSIITRNHELCKLQHTNCARNYNTVPLVMPHVITGQHQWSNYQTQHPIKGPHYMIWVQTEHIYGFPIDNYVNQIYHYFSRSMIHRMTQNSKVKMHRRVNPSVLIV